MFIHFWVSMLVFSGVPSRKLRYQRNLHDFGFQQLVFGCIISLMRILQIQASPENPTRLLDICLKTAVLGMFPRSKKWILKRCNMDVSQVPGTLWASTRLSWLIQKLQRLPEAVPPVKFHQSACSFLLGLLGVSLFEKNWNLTF